MAAVNHSILALARQGGATSDIKTEVLDDEWESFDVERGGKPKEKCGVMKTKPNSLCVNRYYEEYGQVVDDQSECGGYKDC